MVPKHKISDAGNSDVPLMLFHLSECFQLNKERNKIVCLLLSVTTFTMYCYCFIIVVKFIALINSSCIGGNLQSYIYAVGYD